MLRKLLTPDIQRIKKHLFHRYDAPTSPPQARDFLGGLVFAKVVPYPIKWQEQSHRCFDGRNMALWQRCTHIKQKKTSGTSRLH